MASFLLFVLCPSLLCFFRMWAKCSLGALKAFFTHKVVSFEIETAICCVIAQKARGNPKR